MTIKTLNITAHKNDLRGKADDIIGMALQLRAKLKNVGSEPLPERESDVLILALSAFIKEAQNAAKVKFSPSEQELLQVYGFYPRELDAGATPELIDRIGVILEKLRTQGLAGAWTYSLPDHRALLRLYKRHRV